jgi:hypothetical protein
MSTDPRPDRAASARRALLVIQLGALAGTATELVLLEHYDGWKQWIPLALLVAGTVLATLLLLAPRPTAVRAWRGLMIAYVVAGALGVWFHYEGNVEFEIERTPELAGWALFKAAMTGATPALAPGTMLQFGLLGLLLAWLLSEPRR